MKHRKMESSSVNVRKDRKAVLHMPVYDFVKRCLDIVLSVIGGVILLIPMLMLCAAVIIKDYGSPFYIQERIGKDGKHFAMVKLRSMKKNADNIHEMLDEAQQAQYYSEFKLDDDPRLLGWSKPGDGCKCFGAILRKLSLDEVPQIYWNVLIKGNMSLIGPRPILQEELDKNYTKDEQARLLSIKPGLTGYWQAYARNNASYETGERQRMELYYIENRSVWLDVKILFATVGAVLSKSGAK